MKEQDAGPAREQAKEDLKSGCLLRRRKRLILPVLVVASLIGSALGSCSPEGHSSSNKPRQVAVAQFIGRTPDDAHNKLEDELNAEMTTDYDDFSPRGRDVNRYEDIIVSADRKVVTADHPKIRFWTLTPSEVRWFNKHSKMPKARIGARCNMDYGKKLFEPVEELVFVTTKPGQKRAQEATRVRNSYDWKTDQSKWPVEWAERQRVSVGKLWEAQDNAYPSKSVVLGQRPKAGRMLKPGQLMVVYCTSSDYEESAPSDDEVPDFSVPNNDDDNFDFPDRLCPTRFC
jgi:hypothetical protein